MLRREHFDLVVFCHTVSPRDREKVSLEARKRHLGVRVLNVLRFAESCAAPEETVSEPTRLLLKVTDALEKGPRNQQRGGKHVTSEDVAHARNLGATMSRSMTRF